MTLTDAYIISNKDRKNNDYYPTSPLAIHCLVENFRQYMPQKIWEPAAGRGWISKTLQKSHGFDVVSTDLFKYKRPLVSIETGIDYLETKPRATAIVTNPPYKNKLAQRFTEKAINEVDFVAMYLRLTFMESKGRHKLFKNHPPNVLVFSARMNCEEHKFDTFKGQMGGMVAYAWFVWGKDIPPGRIDWIDPVLIAEKYNDNNTLNEFFV